MAAVTEWREQRKESVNLNRQKQNPPIMCNKRNIVRKQINKASGIINRITNKIKYLYSQRPGWRGERW